MNSGAVWHRQGGMPKQVGIVQENHPTSLTPINGAHLELGLGLGLLEDGVELGGLHHVALDLKLARHEQPLGVGLAGNEGAKVGVREGESDCKTDVSGSKTCVWCRDNPPVGFSPRPLETAPVFLRSMFQLSVSPAAFLRVKAKMALPCLSASLRSASLALRAAWIASKAAEEGNLSVCRQRPVIRWLRMHLQARRTRTGIFETRGGATRSDGKSSAGPKLTVDERHSGGVW